MEKNVFSEFTNKYSLSKTLRFELKPVGETLNKMRENLEYDESLQTFLKDQDIEDAYQILKPVFDKIHEEFITQSLESDDAKQINFSTYLQLKQELQELDKKADRYDLKKKEIEGEEKRMGGNIANLYITTSEIFKQTAGKDDKGKDLLKEKGFKVLTENGILKYITLEHIGNFYFCRLGNHSPLATYFRTYMKFLLL